MQRLFDRLSLVSRALILIGFVVALTTVCVVAAAYWALSNEFLAKASADIEVNLRTLTLAYARTYTDTKVTMEDDKVARVVAPRIPVFADHALVDLSASFAGGNATVFEYDASRGNFVRRTTNVKKENGDRAVGTELAPDHPGQPYLRRGEAYKGTAVLFGHKFYTAYQPIFDPEGGRADYWRFARAMFAAGFRKGELVYNTFSYHLTPAGFMADHGARALGCAVVPGGTGQTDMQLAAISALKPLCCNIAR